MASIVFLLAFKPGVEHFFSLCENQESCCVESCTPFALDTENQDQEKENDCNGNSCNPFQSCGSSFVFSLNDLNTELLHREVSTSRNFNYQFNVRSQFDTDFWQPPQNT